MMAAQTTAPAPLRRPTSFLPTPARARPVRPFRAVTCQPVKAQPLEAQP